MHYHLIKLLFIPLLIICTGCTEEFKSYKDNGRPVEEQITDLIAAMTLEEKTDMLHGDSKFKTAGVPRLGIPRWSLSDGPHGVREEIEEHSWSPAGWINDSASYFPTGTALAATWNPELALKMGTALGAEARARDKDVILGPSINIHRTPLCGRNFEYMSEDPYLISHIVVPYIQGVQSQGVAACAKHYALNNQEFDRDSINVILDERALREIYLPGFKAAVQKGDVNTVMGAYNKYQNKFCCENSILINDILKNEWGFRGVVMSDWNATHSTVASALAGLDLEMGTYAPDYDSYYLARPLREAVREGKVPEAIVDDKVHRILRVMFKTGIFAERPSGSFNTKEHQEIAQKIAEEAVVLLKNDGRILPLDPGKLKSIAVIGDNATRRHARGGYSSGIKALYEITPLEGLKNYLSDAVEIRFAQGYEKTSNYQIGQGMKYTSDQEKEQALIEQAAAVAGECDVAVIFAGLNHDFDTEGIDRADMKLPYTQNDLINSVRKVNKRTIVVLISGSPVEMNEWSGQVPAVLQGWFAGMEGGTALARILFGDVNPSGKLPFTFPYRLEDSPAHKLGEYPGDHVNVTYKESIFVGYRYFDSFNVQPQYCFGHGLSYTDFKYDHLKIQKADDTEQESFQVSFRVANTGNYDGAEVVQLYVHDKKSTLKRPIKELKRFDKVFLKKGEIKNIEFKLGPEDLAYYDPEKSAWVVEAGVFYLHVGSSSRDIRLSGSFELKESGIL
jgi:beta-glucosidase